MDIKEEHKQIMREMGLRDEDFKLFDGKFVRYEYDERRGIRIYDPYYRTSYSEYIDVDGWSAWSSERDTFMSDIIEDARRVAQQRVEESGGTPSSKIIEQLKEKFKKR